MCIEFLDEAGICHSLDVLKGACIFIRVAFIICLIIGTLLIKEVKSEASTSPSCSQIISDTKIFHIIKII
jgi:hypothetical protein